MKTILYFGIFDQEFSRNKVYISGLRARGYEVLICTDKTSGFLKYWHLFKKHQTLRGKYDAMIVGYPGYIVVPFAKLITRKPVLFDALCSFYEGEILSRDVLHEIPFRKLYAKTIDWFATRCADAVLVESDKQCAYFITEMGVRAEKVITVYTGVDDSVFYADDSIKKFDRFTVLFRGRITNEAGVETVLRAAKLLEDEPINFLIVGFGWNKEMERFNTVLHELKPKNLRHVAQQLPMSELREVMQKCHLSLGQFADHERLRRTIPHKAFESLVIKLPYITARAEGVSEVFTDGETCLMVRPNDPADLAEKILHLKEDAAHAGRIAAAGYALYKERFAPEKVIGPLLALLETYASR